MNGNHAAKQEAVDRGEHQNGPVVVTDGQQEQHDPQQHRNDGEQLQVPQKPHVSQPATKQPAGQVGDSHDRQDERWPILIDPQAIGKRNQEEGRGEKPGGCKDRKQDVEKKFGFFQQATLEDCLLLWW